MKRGILAVIAVASLASATLIMADDAEQQRIKKLEDAVQQLQQQNQQLQQLIDQIRVQKPGTTELQPVTGLALPFVVPGGKESKLTLGGYIQANGEFGDVSAFEGRFTDGANEIHNRFRVRRARLNLSGDFFENFDFKVEGDFEQYDNTDADKTSTVAKRTALSTRKLNP